MTREESRKIANYALPKLLNSLPRHMKFELLSRGDSGNEESLLEKLVAKHADDILWTATKIENEKREQYI